MFTDGPWGMMRITQIEMREKAALDVASEPLLGGESQATVASPAAALNFSCEIAPASFLQRMAYLVGSRKPLTESPQFDLQYAIVTDDPAKTRQLLTRYVQAQIDRLRYFQGGRDVRVSLNRGTLSVGTRGVLRSERLLRQFVALALELYEQAVASYGVGIEVVRTASQPAADAVCKICGDPLDVEEIVYCRVCDTPHHRECWRYFGGCAVYACGERRFNRTPRLARSPQ